MSRGRRRDILVAEVLGAELQRRVELAGCFLDAIDVTAFRSVDETLVIFDRKLRVDGEPNRSTGAVAAGGFYSVFDTLASTRSGDVLAILIRREHLFRYLLPSEEDRPSLTLDLRSSQHLRRLSTNSPKIEAGSFSVFGLTLRDRISKVSKFATC
jgi:hypothetical protein